MQSLTEDRARNALKTSAGRLDVWIAVQDWVDEGDGWTVEGGKDGWSFEIVPLQGGLQILAMTEGLSHPAAWTVSLGVGTEDGGAPRTLAVA